MITNREDFLMQILHCGVLDLKLIDGVGYDWCDILDNDIFEGGVPFNLNNIMRMVFEYGFSQIEAAVDNRIDYLEDTEKTYGLSDSQAEELEALRTLNPMEDFDSYHNYIDTHVWCEQNGDVYQKYMSEALDAFADGTGYEIPINEE